MASTDTKTTILDAAEEMFAEAGFAATSLRELTARAGANLAAVNYHFGSKEELAIAVLRRRIAPINDERRARLQALPARPTLAAIVRAFVEPLLCTTANLPTPSVAPTAGFCRLFGRLMVEQPPFLRSFLAEQFRDLGWRFEAVLQKALPGLDTATVWWRLHFLIGAMAHTLQNAETLTHLTDGLCRHDDPETIVEHLVAFAVGGFQAKASVPRPRVLPRRRQTSSRR